MAISLRSHRSCDGLLFKTCVGLSRLDRARTFRPRKIVHRLWTLLEPAGPAPEDLVHAFRIDAELGHRHAAIDGFAILRNQAVAQDEPAHAIDHHALALELWNRRGEARQR